MSNPTKLKFEFELSGQGNGWTDKTSDVNLASGVQATRGIFGNSPRDRVATTGVATFSLLNWQTPGIDRLQGQYSPGNWNQLDGWGKGTGVRITVQVYSGGSYNDTLQWTGTVSSINPSPGRFLEKLVHVTAVDYMDKLARHRMQGVATQLNKDEDVIFDAIIDAMEFQPRARETGAGPDNYPYALDQTRDETDAPLTELQRLAQSSLALIYVKGDGTLVYEPRTVRAEYESPATSAAFIEFTEDELLATNQLKVDDNSENRINRVQTVIAPRAVDTSNQVLFRTNKALAFDLGVTIEVRGLFTDPDQRATRVAGTSMVTPVSGTDYAFNTASDGSGTDVTSLMTVSATFTSNAVLYSITNNTNFGTVYSVDTGGTPKLQARGLGVYSYEGLTLIDEDTTSIGQHGINDITLEMPYQDDVRTAQEAAEYLLHKLSQERKRVMQVPIMLDSFTSTDALLIATRDISDRFSINELMTGLGSYDPTGSEESTGVHFFINGITINAAADGVVWLYWTPVLADETRFWYLDQMGASELGETTRLGFGYIVGHTDVAHVDYYTDQSHVDTAHTDTHGDVEIHNDAYVDHSDSAHVDSHGDTAHGDVAHSDADHEDSHSDIDHGDIAHEDSNHTDSHGDEVHDDVAHEDHDDEGQYDDEPHDNTPHTDTHGDVDHGDDHTDIAHADTHNDSAHGDSHTDTPHADTHSDVDHDDHTDSAHNDGSHTDTHGDVDYVDTPEYDDHGDTPYGDQNIWWILLALLGPFIGGGLL